MSEAACKNALILISFVSLVLGVVGGLALYGDLADVRAWNFTGLVFIVLLGLWCLAVGLRHASKKA